MEKINTNIMIMAKFLELIPPNTGLELPPKVFLDMGGEFIDFVEGKLLTARFPIKERYMNPFGFMQGGIIVAAIDNTIAPLSYVLAPPNITKEINTTFKRPIKSSELFIDVVASMVEKTSSYIILQAEVRNESGKLAAKGIAKCIFVKNRK
ncbi:PaaI family thioesterase [Methylobacter psychrophilus]|uniref:PaaI family thioesterase n=1 Tax=Methylobacter psychrophilus TaxID=96941 RepID=UPI0021D49526|nr:PaaI family thioesterase [Methylobacter psychrophilus]